MQIRDAYWTMGQYDMVVTLVGGETALASFVLAVSAMGNVRTETLRAIDATEMRKAIAGMPSP